MYSVFGREALAVLVTKLEEKSGNVVATMRLLFRETQPAPLTIIMSAIINNQLSDIPLVKDSLKLLQGRDCSSSPCHVNATCSDLQDGQYNCTCKEGFDGNGTYCKGVVKVKVELVIKDVYKEELKNESSQEYIDLKKNVTEELTELFKETENFVEVIVQFFISNNTVTVQFIVVYSSKDPTTKLNEVEEVTKILEQEVKDGKVTTLTIKKNSFVIREPPPPPIKIFSGNVTTSEIFIRWDPPNRADQYSITSYIISYHLLDEKVPDTAEANPSPKPNVLLTGLTSDTFYNIFVQSKNRFGEGENSKSIEVKTEKEGEGSNFIIIVGATLGVVVFVMAFLVGCFIAKRHQRSYRRNHAKQNEPTRAASLSFHDRPHPGDWVESPRHLREPYAEEMPYLSRRYYHFVEEPYDDVDI